MTLDLPRACLHRAGREIELRPKSFEVLRYMVENAGRLVPRNELMNAVWPNVTVTDESLTRCVSDVRMALDDDDQRIIKTVLRRGYTFLAPVTQHDANAGSNGRAAPDKVAAKNGDGAPGIFDRASAAATAAHHSLLRSRRIDGDLGPAQPRGSEPAHGHLSPHLR
jgi:DNA-binding winged helix-turn-helix (wHTH) protein